MTDRPIPFIGPMVCGLLREVEAPGTGKSKTRRALDPQPSGIAAAWWHEPNTWKIEPESNRCSVDWRPPKYQPGDLLWVKEAWRAPASLDTMSPKEIGEAALNAGYPRPWSPIHYIADASVSSEMDWYEFGRRPGTAVLGRYRHGRFMPRWASCLTLEVTDVKVERVQEISAEDALAEGIIRHDPTPEDLEWHKAWAEEHGYDPADDPMQPVWLAPGTRRGWGMTKAERNEPQWGPTPQFAFRCLWDHLNAARGFGWETNPWVAAITFRVHLANIDAIRERANG